MSGRGRWATLVATTEAIRGVHPSQVQDLVADLSGRSRWLAPLAYVAGTIALVFDGVVLLLRSWRLLLLQLASAVWIWGASWNLRTHLFSHKHPPLSKAWLIAAGALVMTQIAYWCNATFAFTLTQGQPIRIRPAFASARTRWRPITLLALAFGSLQAIVWLVVPHLGLHWFWICLVAMFGVQIYMFIALPMWLLGVRKTGTRRDRSLRTVTTSAVSGIAAIPGFLLNRIGLLLMSVPNLWWVGFGILAISAVVHVAASSSARVVKVSVRLRTAPTQTT